MDDKSGLIMQQRRTRAEIERLVAEFTSSGMNRTEFCRHHGMSLGTLNRYLKQRREQGDSGAIDGGLVAVELTGAKLATDCDFECGLAVLLSRGRKIEVGAGFDGPTLQRLVNLLEKM
jgi:hypothetical protein